MNENFFPRGLHFLCGAPAGAKTIFPIRPFRSAIVNSTDGEATITTTYEVYSDGIKQHPRCDEGYPAQRFPVEIFKTIVRAKDGKTEIINLHGEGLWEDREDDTKIRWVPICHPVDWDPKTGRTDRIR